MSADGTYSGKTFYKAQFLGSYARLNWNSVWKCKLHICLALQHKLLTADKMRTRGRDVSNTCKLCNVQDETAAHLTVNCTFARETWRKVGSWSQVQQLNFTQPVHDLGEWWSSLMVSKKGSGEPGDIYCMEFVERKEHLGVELNRSSAHSTRHQHVASRAEIFVQD
uniref:Reverse transcriptase zinc-binding domain-containing protein n=1 Tax=Arundo donax TaxID=35708 RepID=A0A0A9BGC0_ARUDO